MITGKQIVNHYTKDESGMLWGTGLYYMLGITSKAPKCYGILSNKVQIVSYFGDKSKTVPVDMSDENAEVKAWVMPVNINFTPTVVKMLTAVQLLDIKVKKPEEFLIDKWRELVYVGVLGYEENEFNRICADKTISRFFRRGIETYKRLVKKARRLRKELYKVESSQ